jgi:hypothetical protein
MYRGTLAVLGVGLIVLWLVGLGSSSSNWLTWLDGIVGACSLIVAGVGFGDVRVERAASGWLIGLAISLFILWVVGLVTRTPVWLDWWTFGFACAYLLAGVGIGAQTSGRLPTARPV